MILSEIDSPNGPMIFFACDLLCSKLKYKTIGMLTHSMQAHTVKRISFLNTKARLKCTVQNLCNRILKVGLYCTANPAFLDLHGSSVAKICTGDFFFYTAWFYSTMLCKLWNCKENFVGFGTFCSIMLSRIQAIMLLD